MWRRAQLSLLVWLLLFPPGVWGGGDAGWDQARAPRARCATSWLRARTAGQGSPVRKRVAQRRAAAAVVRGGFQPHRGWGAQGRAPPTLRRGRRVPAGLTARSTGGGAGRPGAISTQPPTARTAAAVNIRCPSTSTPSRVSAPRWSVTV